VTGWQTVTGWQDLEALLGCRVLLGLADSDSSSSSMFCVAEASTIHLHAAFKPSATHSQLLSYIYVLLQTNCSRMCMYDNSCECVAAQRRVGAWQHLRTLESQSQMQQRHDDAFWSLD